jgi:hypothetical protein
MAPGLRAFTDILSFDQRSVAPTANKKQAVLDCPYESRAS